MPKQRTILIGSILVLCLLTTLAILLFMRSRSETKTVLPRGTSSEYNFADVQSNNSNASCWVSFGGQVFDITRFIANLEPNQATELSKLCGTNLDTVPSPIKTIEKLSEYQIGILAP